MYLFASADYSEWEIVLIFFKYFLVAGGLYLVYYRFFLNRFITKKLQPQIPERKQVLSEIKYSLSTLMIYAMAGAGIWLAKQNGYTLIYDDWKEYGIFYFVVSFPLMVFMNDTYFYWVHRFLHLPAIFPVAHKVHHRYKSPSPWAAFAFHPFEAILETLILPLIVFTIPAHPLIIFFSSSTCLSSIYWVTLDLKPIRNGFLKIGSPGGSIPLLITISITRSSMQTMDCIQHSGIASCEH
jgi:lathosterol oxidase